MNFVEILALKPLNLDKKPNFFDIFLKSDQVLHGIRKDYTGITLPSVHRITRLVAPSTPPLSIACDDNVSTKALLPGPRRDEHFPLVSVRPPAAHCIERCDVTT